MTDLTRWDPFRKTMPLRDAMDRLFEESFVRPFGERSWMADGEGTLALDIYENDDNLVVETSLPGISPDEVDISVAGNSLTIKGETKREEKKEKGDYYHCEISRGTFTRSVALPHYVDSDRAKAAFENGVLELTLPKVEKAKRRTVKID